MKLKGYFVICMLCLPMACKSPLERAKNGEQLNNEMENSMNISQESALEIAAKDASQAYRDLSPYKVLIELKEGNWQVDYELKDENSLGGGPHYLIDGKSGEILSRRYEQ